LEAGEGMRAIVRLIWRKAKRWRWSVVAIFMALLMDYVLFWMDNPLMEIFGATERAAASYFLLSFIFFAIIAFVLYELKVEVKTYYVCEDCHRNFSLDGHREDQLDAKCPFCSSNKIHFVTTVEKRENETKRVTG